MYAATPTKQAGARRKVFSVISPERRQEAAIRVVGGGFTIPDGDINDAHLHHLDRIMPQTNPLRWLFFCKSVFLSQRAVIDILLNNRNYLICRKIARTLRNSVFKEITGRSSTGEPELLFQRTEMTITADNGYQILFCWP